MKYKDVKNFTWYKIDSIRNIELRYVYKTDVVEDGRDLILGFNYREDKYNFYIMTLSKNYWERYDRARIEEGFPGDLNRRKIERKFIKIFFEVGVE